MRPVPLLDTSDKRLSWKTNLRKLFRTNGLRQREIAIEMARLISLQSGRQVNSNAFISSLSRFINGKDSAFPGWFYKEESRLLPLAQAIGVESVEIFWTILKAATGEKEVVKKGWHPAFPESSIEISAKCNGKLISIIADSLALRLKRSVLQHMSIWIIGKKGSGRSYAANQLVNLLEKHNIHLPILPAEQANLYRSEILICEGSPQEFGPYDVKLMVDAWGPDELSVVVSQLHDVLRPAQYSRLTRFLALAKESPGLLGTDLRPVMLIDLLAAIAEYDLPQDPMESRKVLLQYYWQKQQLEDQRLHRLTLEHVVFFWADFFLHHFCGTWLPISQTELIRCIDSSFRQHASLLLDKKDVYSWIEIARTGNKKQRENALERLESWASMSTSEHIAEVFVATSMFKEVSGALLPEAPDKALLFAIYGLVLRKQSGMQKWENLSSSSSGRLAKELAILGLEAQGLITVLEQAPKWLSLDVSRFLIRFAAVSTQRLPEDALRAAWADVLYAEIHRVFWHPGAVMKDDLYIDIQIVSMRYIYCLPSLSKMNALQELSKEVSDAAKKIVSNWKMSPLRDPQSLSPGQFPPRNIVEWSNWKILPPLSISAAEVLYQRAKIGDHKAIRLLCEGEGKDEPHWSAVNINYRLEWIGFLPSTRATYGAFQLICAQLWQQSGQLSDMQTELLIQAAKRIGEAELTLLLNRWTHPLSLTQQIILNQRDKGANLSSCALFLAQKMGYQKLMRMWFLRIRKWLDYSKIYSSSFVDFEGQKISSQGLSWPDLQSSMLQFCILSAEHLYRLGSPEELRKVWLNPPRQFSADFREQWVSRSFSLLIQKQDIAPITAWINGGLSDDKTFRELLLNDPRLLHKAWLQDKSAKRRQDILTIASLQNQIPTWAISSAKKMLRHQQIWPNWLSPYRLESLPLLRDMLEQAIEPHRSWWAFLIHRHESWPAELLRSMRYFLHQDPDPFARRSVSVVGGVTVNNTPGLDVDDWLVLVKSRLQENQAESWLKTGVVRLWSMSTHAKGPHRLFLARLLIELQLHDQLFFSGWEHSSGRLMQLLIQQWMKYASPADLRQQMNSSGILGELARKKLLLLGDKEAYEQTRAVFLQKLSIPALDALALRFPKVIIAVLQDALRLHPHKRAELLRIATGVVNKLPSQEVDLLCWIRRTSLEG